MEHWEAIESISDTDDSERMTTGTLDVDVHANTAVSKAIVRRFYEEVWLAQKPEFIEKFVSEELTQHASDIQNGLAGLRRAINQEIGFQPEILHRIVAQGDFVVVQLEGLRDGVPFVSYDVLRTKEGKIAEMWRVQQQIPNQMPHKNGMI